MVTLIRVLPPSQVSHLPEQSQKLVGQDHEFRRIRLLLDEIVEPFNSFIIRKVHVSTSKTMKSFAARNKAHRLPNSATNWILVNAGERG